MTPSELITRHIEPNPHKPGVEEAVLKERGVPVWAIVGYWQVVDEDEQRVAKDYNLPLEAVHAALAYYQRYRAAIDTRLAANAA